MTNPYCGDQDQVSVITNEDEPGVDLDDEYAADEDTTSGSPTGERDV